MFPEVLESRDRGVRPMVSIRSGALPAKRPGRMVMRRRLRMATLDPPRTRASFGDVVLTAFDEAAFHSADPREIAWLATLVINRFILRAVGTAPAEARAEADGEQTKPQFVRPAQRSAGCER